MQILITGREQNLSIAEAESLFGDIQILNSQAISTVQDASIDISRLGGTIKIARRFELLKDADPKLIIESCIKQVLADSPQTKFNFGISSYENTKLNISKLGLSMKKELQSVGMKPRLVKGNEDNINAASIKHNKLASSGYEFLIVASSSGVHLARTIAAQDVDNYSKRDYDKPCRDSKVGMLPPKLSQMLINLTRPDSDTRIVDPFCGSGSLLIEASLMGLSAEGSDMSKKMIECTKANVEWFYSEYPKSTPISVSDAADATLREYPKSKYAVATEGYLGENFSSQPTQTQLNEQIERLKELYLNLFKHLQNQATTPSAVCVCIPFWHVNSHKIEIDIIDDIVNLGYTKSEFKSVRSESLEYHREGQYTGRQILIFRNNQE